MIENVLLFSISNYFRKFSIAYKEYHKVDHFDNDWYEFVEYGTTNPLTIFLQQVGFDREASLFLEQPSNRKKYVVEENGEIKIHRSIFFCGDENVETQVNDMNAAKEAFAQYLNDASLDSRQIYFVNQIVEYIVHNGMMKDLSVLQEAPFTDHGSIVEVFTDLTVWMGIRNTIEKINSNAVA